MEMNEFKKLFNSIIRCYSKQVFENLPTLSDFENGSSNNWKDKWHKSVGLRIKAISELRKSRDLGLKINTKKIWALISESIQIIPIEATISSIGSQGFLSVPLFKYDTEMKDFEFIRLHIWDKSINKFVNTQTRDNFSIHNHAFHAESWILCGQIINNRFIVEESKTNNQHSIFTIAYNSTLNEVNQHTSIANRTSTFAKVTQVSQEVHFRNGNYCIKAGDFHKSGSKEGGDISATLFSFTADKNFERHSSVIGPSEIQSSEINRKELINPSDLIKKIDEIISQYE